MVYRYFQTRNLNLKLCTRNNQGTGQHASLQLINSVTNHQQMEESSNELEQGGKHLPRNKKIPGN